MEKKDRLLASTLKTLAYSQIFSFPLTKKELYQRLITPPPASFSCFEKKLRIFVNQKKVTALQGYYFLPGNKKTAAKRITLTKNWKSKYQLAKKAAHFLAQIPEVFFVGLTGTLALGIAKPQDDLDLMIITTPNTLWLTRLKIYFQLKTKGKKENLRARKPKSKKTNNQLCLNLFLDASNLALEPKQQNLFTAYQIAFLKPLINKHQAYEQFLAANSWTKNFLPNAFSAPNLAGCRSGNLRGFLAMASCKVEGKNITSLLCYFLQRFYMRGKPKAKKITLTQAFFHPQNQSAKTLKRFKALTLKKSYHFLPRKHGG